MIPELIRKGLSGALSLLAREHAAPASDLPPEKLSLRDLLAEDFATHDGLLMEPGFWAVAVHRLGERAAGAGLARGPLVMADRLLATAVDWTWGIYLPASVHLGRRVRIWHHGSIVINARSVGNDVHLRQNTTIGPVYTRDANRPECLPVLGDRVDIGAGACVLGGVSVGIGAIVGANSVVVDDVPSGATAFGVPARILPA
jgi:serine O-acetyltransferase